jgi:hypothetical protein
MKYAWNYYARMGSIEKIGKCMMIAKKNVRLKRCVEKKE